jgi:hypothetical protein
MATIYAKTPDGQNEIETRARRITPRARSLLILIDGKRHDEELAKLVQQFDETLALLLEGGLVEAVGTTSTRSSSKASAPAEAPAAPPPPAEITADVAVLRREAVRAVNDLLGPMGESLAVKLEKAGNVVELREVLERAVAYIANARGGAAAAQFATRFLTPPPPPA